MKEVRFFQTIQVRLAIVYVLLILVAVQVIGVYFVRTLESMFIGTSSENMSKQVQLLVTFVEPYLIAIQNGDEEVADRMYGELDKAVKNLNTISRAEIQIIDATGKIVSTTSQRNQSIVGKRNTETVVTRALQGIPHHSDTLVDETGSRNQVIAMPVGSGGKVIGAVYMIASLDDMYGNINRINRILFSGTAIALALTALIGTLLAHTITGPIKDITTQAKAIARGNFNRQVKVHSGDEIGQLGAAFNEMTERLKEALSQNEEEKEKLASILINMSDGVIATDDMGRIILMNVRAREMLSLGEETMYGNRDIAEVLGIPKQSVDRYVFGEHHSLMIEFTHKESGEPISVRVTFTPIHRRGKGIAGTIVVLQDVTEQEALERARREFVANVSHELRTPLTTIKSYMEALEDGALQDPALSRKFIHVVRGETERMIRLVSDLLHLSKFDSKGASLAKEWTDIRGMLEEVADRFAFQLQQKAISITLGIDEQVGEALVDPDQLDQVLDNLVSNAIKYTGDGGQIELNARRGEGGQLEITVKDTGIGIPKKDIEKIFDRFYRVDKARSRSMGGTGLGLSIAREIIRAHGGQIAIESTVNEGTSVKVILPADEKREAS